jgi:hypothetical protein
MKRLWVFGDNNSAIFGKTKERRFKFYKKYRNGVFPKSWSELLASTLNLELKNLAVQGQSNYDIFDMFCNVINDIKKDDIVIIESNNNKTLFEDIDIKYKQIIEEIKNANYNKNEIYQEYTEELLVFVNKIYSDDFETFGYKKCETVEELLNYYIQ